MVTGIASSLTCPSAWEEKNERERIRMTGSFSLVAYVHSRLPYRNLLADDYLLDEHFLATLDDDAAL